MLEPRFAFRQRLGVARLRGPARPGPTSAPQRRERVTRELLDDMRWDAHMGTTRIPTADCHDWRPACARIGIHFHSLQLACTRIEYCTVLYYLIVVLLCYNLEISDYYGSRDTNNSYSTLQSTTVTYRQGVYTHMCSVLLYSCIFKRSSVIRTMNSISLNSYVYFW